MVFPTLSVPRALERSFCGAAAACVGVSCLASGLLLGARRLAGGFDHPAAAAILAVAAMGVALVLATDMLARLAGNAGRPWPLVARAGLTLALVAVALPPRFATAFDAVALAAAAAFAGVAIAAPWLAGPRLAGLGLAGPRSTGGPAGIDGIGRASLPIATSAAWPAASPSPDAASATVPADLPSSLPHAAHLVQRLERYESQGADCLRGRIALAVPQGARVAHGHVGFCPPFARTPTVEVTTEYDGVEAVVSAGEVLPWGVRVECRLDEPAEEDFEIPVDVFATTAA